MELEIKQLPTTPLMLENAAFLMQEDYVNAWPLICDPTSRVLDWLYQYKRDKGLVVVRYSVSKKYTLFHLWYLSIIRFNVISYIVHSSGHPANM